MGSFIFSDLGMHSSQIDIGARDGGTHFLTGCISAIEMYTDINLTEPIPTSLRKLIISNQMVNVID